ncbi:cyclopropane-fatty-acyl-phospholipid synthase family protein [Serratia sp. DD3]|uniref:SAM-dependent methyltransferase n=1 Tax=Serratia sp. DD3 TaxID=1410619 RepID=UPI0004D6300D|nr:cyclopropane-fatty-acyl-phospholipid synthase family protein [Serratia sp. DD3]KEY59739.1 cyclopropane-fatty-acyl-phospholipid synthase [Serratia sp. DD3]
MTDPTYPLTQTLSRRARITRQVLFRLLSQIKGGGLTLHEGNQQFCFGEMTAARQAVVVIHSPSVYRRLFSGGSIAAAETWMDGEWDSPDLTSVLEILAQNSTVMDQLENGFKWLNKPFARLQHWFNRNNRDQAKQNIAAHYDLGNDFYRSFLDESLLYSSALFSTGINDLPSAQVAKMARLCEQLALTADDHLLEIGTGWGALAEYAARHFGCRVTTTTLSQAQYDYSTKRIAQAGLTEQVTVLLKDYRDLDGEFDKIVSVEMIEAVGEAFLPVFFRSCQQRLRPGGKMVLQAITIQDQRYKQYSQSVDFIQRYIFPGGFLPSISALSNVMTHHTDFVIRNLFDMGIDYAQTLNHWRHRFLHAWPQISKQGFDDHFHRMWLFYLCYCEAGFQARTISAVQMTVERT